MTSRVLPVVFPNKQGLKLFGIVHSPEVSVSDVGIVLLSPGIKSRVAPHRMYNKIAAELVALGLTVLRFDFYGLGDSEGELSEAAVADLYGAIQVGRYVDDTRAAMDWMQKSFGIGHFILGGLCGGAITGLLASVSDARVVGLIGIGMPVTLDSTTIDPVRYMTVGELGGIRAKYLRKLRDPKSWLRLLTLRSDLRLLTRSITSAIEPFIAKRRVVTAQAPAPAAGNVNPHFAPAFLRVMAQSRPVLLLFGGSDRLYFEFQDKFMAHHRDVMATHSQLLDVHVIKDANHILTFESWQREMLAHTRRWLAARFLDIQASPAVRIAG